MVNSMNIYEMFRYEYLWDGAYMGILNIGQRVFGFRYQEYYLADVWIWASWIFIRGGLVIGVSNIYQMFAYKHHEYLIRFAYWHHEYLWRIWMWIFIREVRIWRHEYLTEVWIPYWKSEYSHHISLLKYSKKNLYTLYSHTIHWLFISHFNKTSLTRGCILLHSQSQCRSLTKSPKCFICRSRGQQQIWKSRV